MILLFRAVRIRRCFLIFGEYLLCGFTNCHKWFWKSGFRLILWAWVRRNWLEVDT